MANKRCKALSTLLLLLLHLSTTALSIGVNYGTLGNNLPSPPDVVNFLKTKTVIDAVKIFDTNPDILRAFANSGISVTVTVPNGEIPRLATDFEYAKQWVEANIKPFVPQTQIKYITVGNEIMHTTDQNLIQALVPSMYSLQRALLALGITHTKVSTAHSLSILQISEPPSAGRFFPGYDKSVFTPMLEFLRKTKGPFIVNPYPYFGYSDQKANYALFKPNPGIYDNGTKITYKNMFDATMDAVFSAMKAVGFADVGLVVGETGWPTVCEGWNACQGDNAVQFNRELIKHVSSGVGTPLMPGRNFETYIFALFQENLKPGPVAERNWGIFRPDFTPVYDLPIMRDGKAVVPTPRKGRGGGGRRKRPVPVPAAGGKKWCVAKPQATEAALKANIDYVCGKGIDCKPIQAGGSCFEPNNLKALASFVMNAFYQSNGKNDFNCDFSGSGLITTVDPTHGACKFNA